MCVKNAFVARRDPNPSLERKTMTGAFLVHLELLRRRSHIQLMRPQTRLLVVQPQIRLAHGIGAHLLPGPLVLAIPILDPAVSNRVHDVHALLAELARQRLRQLPHGSATRAVRGELRAAPQRSQRAGEDQRLATVSPVSQHPIRKGKTHALLLPTIRQRLLPMIGIEPLHTLLRKRKSPANILLQTALEFLPRLLEKRLLGRVLDAVDCDFGFQPREALVRLDVLKRPFDRCLGSVGGERLEDGVRRRLVHCSYHGLQVLGTSREERDCEVAVRRRGEDARYACTLGVLALHALRYLYDRNAWNLRMYSVGPGADKDCEASGCHVCSLRLALQM